ncbi:hypothetical protein CEY00_Acc21558 [Actinidia chinensis var. chinensis]|uniref:At4g15545-like C-terminal domain-containing protein n=1 Tax=Actinidia chinensis var. chinensis TaxID=1590841 RepID=A0A2R6Q7E7_ACTCC|nr:hypothetical protein CEY00_Acc21558 [Actinidia chinensis var. chinensis]
MSQSSESGPDFHLPDEILSVIPTDPYDQLDLARKITSMAIASRVSKLESEVGRLSQKVNDKDRKIYELEEKVSHLQQANREANTQLKIVNEDNMKLVNERDSLAVTAKKLGRDLAKLETFKRQLMQSLNDDSLSQAETVDIMTCDQSVSKPYAVRGEKVNGHTTHHYLTNSTEGGYTTDDVSKQAGQRFSITPYITPRLTPTGTPKIISTAGSPIRYSAAGSPQKTSGITSPTRTQYEGHGALSSWYPSSHQSSAANSPPRGRPMPARTPRIDGKEFFRQARSRLSYEQFSAFLANVKELNAQKQSREETLRKAEQIFGTDNKDLYSSFQGLLNRTIR